MIGELFKALGFVLKWIVKGIKLIVKGIGWYLKGSADILETFKEKRAKPSKKEEIL